MDGKNATQMQRQVYEQGHGSFKRRVSPKRRILQTQLLYMT